MDLFISKQILRNRQCFFRINSDKKSKPSSTCSVQFKSSWLFPQNQEYFSARILHHMRMGFCDSWASWSAYLATHLVTVKCAEQTSGSGLVRWNSDSLPITILDVQLARFWAHSKRCKLYTLFAPFPSCYTRLPLCGMTYFPHRGPKDPSPSPAR